MVHINIKGLSYYLIFDNLDLRPSAKEHIQKDFFDYDVSRICDLCKKTQEELLDIPSLTPYLVDYIESYLNKHGLHLGMTDEELDGYIDEEYDEKLFNLLIQEVGDKDNEQKGDAGGLPEPPAPLPDPVHESSSKEEDNRSIAGSILKIIVGILMFGSVFFLGWAYRDLFDSLVSHKEETSASYDHHHYLPITDEFVPDSTYDEWLDSDRLDSDTLD